MSLLYHDYQTTVYRLPFLQILILDWNFRLKFLNDSNALVSPSVKNNVNGN